VNLNSEHRLFPSLCYIILRFYGFFKKIITLGNWVDIFLYRKGSTGGEKNSGGETEFGIRNAKRRQRRQTDAKSSPLRSNHGVLQGPDASLRTAFLRWNRSCLGGVGGGLVPVGGMRI
jgi:hypothetical protein